MKRKLILFFLLLLSLHSIGQDFNYYQYDKDLLPATFFTGRRDELRKKMPERSVAIVFANPIRNRSNDVDYDYHQDPNFYYLTGFREPNSLLLIFKEPVLFHDKKYSELLFVPDRNKSRESWVGRRAGVEGAKIISGVEGVFLAQDFIDDSSLFADTAMQALSCYLHKGITNDRDDPADLFEISEHLQSSIDNTGIYNDTFLLKKFLASMREVKTQEELNLLAHSIDITCAGFIAMMKSVRPDMSEYQLQAEGEYVFKKKGAENLGYLSICGSGENSCILHYNTNRRTFNGNELILLDMGAEYHGYSSDVTRTIPVNGKFSPEQKIIYELVLKAQEAGIAAAIVGNPFKAPHQEAVRVISEGLVKLGIISSPDDYRQYFFHGTSHYLGLDVHDAGNFGPLAAGNVITVEPGIYIPENSPCDKKWWNIGIRIEDDILIKNSGPVNLSEAAPRSIEEIEKLYGQNWLMNK
jgi:Xaa-Pro aminopeptidase